MSFKDATVSDLVGETVTTLEGLRPGSDEVVFHTASGKRYRMRHYQDCCESVEVNEVVGNPDDLVGTPILIAREDTNRDNPPNEGYNESWTWTFYNFSTIKGHVTVRWLGESNGCYGEEVSFEEATP